jgi:antibiotic biosynthesis monooxygenase (ABM) superfamily enzyme
VSEGAAFVTTRLVDPGYEVEYAEWLVRMQQSLVDVPGCLGSDELPAIEGEREFWTQVVRFEDKSSSLAWSSSPQLADLLKEIAPYTRDFEVATLRTGRSGWLTFGLATPANQGAPARWKQYLAAMSILFPTVVALQYLLAPMLQMPKPVVVLIMNAVAMAVVMLLGMPLLSRLLSGWLMPKGSLPVAKTAGISALLLGAIGVMLVVFLLALPPS